jgi:hypothetical protein
MIRQTGQKSVQPGSPLLQRFVGIGTTTSRNRALADVKIRPNFAERTSINQHKLCAIIGMAIMPSGFASG